MDGTILQLDRTPLRVVQAVSLALVAFHLVHLCFAGVFMDESYYWMWGQHPALSYYDHPPLNAWLLGLSSLLFGWTRLALKLPVALAFLADILALYLLSRRIAGTGWQSHFWLTLLLFLVTPIYWMVTTVAIPDHLLLTGCLFSIYFFYRFFADRAAGQPGATRDLLLAAFVLGLAGLTKYNAAFLGFGVFAFIVLRDRKLLVEPRLYLAVLLALLVQTPVIIWNVTDNFASWAFIAHGRHAGLRATVDGVYPFVIGIVIFISPLLFWPIWKFASWRTPNVPGIGFARATFLVSTIAITVIAFTTLTLFHWNLVAYAAMLPFLALYMRPRWLLVGQVLYGIVFAVAVFVNYGVVPLTDVDGWRDEATAWSYGWAPVAAAVEQARAEHKVGFVATADYTTAGLLGFALQDRDVTSLSPHTEAFDFWFDAKAHAGQDAILYGDRWRPLTGEVSRLFKTVTELSSFETVVHGRVLDTRHVYLGTDFTPDE